MKVCSMGTSVSVFGYFWKRRKPFPEIKRFIHFKSFGDENRGEIIRYSVCDYHRADALNSLREKIWWS
jgi:hypothetical protein